jgi:hypothetical protein
MSAVYADFRGPRSGTAPLTWGQRSIWKAIDEFAPHHGWLNICRVLTVPKRAPADVASVARTIGDLMSRHESLRTRIAERDGVRRQEVFDAGRLELSVVECAADDDTAFAHQVKDRLGAAPYDFHAEWPLRVALVVVGGKVRHIAIVFSHCAVDFHASEIVLRELRLLLLRGAIAQPAGAQTYDIAQREAGDLRGRTYRALDHWTGAYDRLPRSMFAEAGPPLTPRYRRALLVSRAIDPAMRLIAARHRVSTSTVLVAATAAVIGGWTGHDTVGLFTMVNNRIPPGYAEAVAKLNQIGLFVLDLADRPDFDALVGRTWQAAMRAYRNAYYDPVVMDRAFTEIGRPPGSALEPHCYVNDLRLPGNTEAASDVTAEAVIRASMMDSELTWPETLDRFAWRFRLQILDAPVGVGLSVTADTAYLPPERVERFLYDTERLIVDAAFGEVRWPWSGATVAGPR